MSQSGFTPIQVYRSATPGAVPLAGNLAAGELALNTADQKLFFKNAGGAVVNIDTANGTVTSVSGTGTVNGITLTGTVTSSGSLTLGGTLSGVSLTSQVSGTLPVANGGTGVTSSTGTVAVVLSNTPTLVTPILGVASATSIATGLGLVGTPAYTFTGDLNTGMWSPAADTVAVSTGGAEAMRINSGGNVGIGTATPGAKLDVVGSVRATAATYAFQALGGASTQTSIALTREVAATDEKTWEILSGSGGFSVRAINDAYSASQPALSISRGTGATVDNIRLSTAGSERLRVDNAGFVGIGTSTPSARLNVVGHNEFALGLVAQTSSTQTAFLNHPVAALYNSSTTVGNGLSLRYQIADTGGVTRTAGGVGMISTAKDASSVTADMYFYTGSTEKMRILSGGNVGIGTSAPAAKLEVSTNTGTEVLKITQTDATGGTIARMRLSHGSGTGGVFEVGAGYGVVGLVTSGPFVFTTNNTERMRIDSTGNVGIGTSAPAAKLDVTATNGASGLNVLTPYGGNVVASGVFTSGNNSGLFGGGFGLKVFDKNDNGGGSTSGYGVYVSSPYDGVNASGNTYSLNKYGIFVDDLYGFNGVNAANTWGVYAKGGLNNYFAGNVGIGTSAPVASAILDVQSTTKGVRMPNMTTAQMNAISSPAAGLMVFNTSLARLCYYTGSAWQTIL